MLTLLMPDAIFCDAEHYTLIREKITLFYAFAISPATLFACRRLMLCHRARHRLFSHLRFATIDTRQRCHAMPRFIFFHYICFVCCFHANIMLMRHIYTPAMPFIMLKTYV